jgi:uncharacterized protein
MTLLKLIYISAGTLSLCLGLLGIVIPGLPTTPFLLLTAALYLRSSEKLYNWLLANKIAGPYILNYRKNRGLTVKGKAYAIIFQWLMIGISIYWGIENPVLKYIVAGAGITGSLVILLAIPTARPQG